MSRSRPPAQGPVLIACGSCRRQYDVSGMQVGEWIRCLCGELAVVPVQKPREARTLHCSSCGGRLKEQAAACEYCGSTVAPEDRSFGPVCPECLARLPKRGRFCQACGIEIKPEKIQAMRVSARCPRCKGELTRCQTEKAQFTECSACGGLWLEESLFERLVEARDACPLGKVTARSKGAAAPGPSHGAGAVSYLPCPVCGDLMHRKNFGGSSGVVIDWCKGHGFWFDAQELEKVMEFVQGGGLDRARKQEIARAEERLRRLESRKRDWRREPAPLFAPPLTILGPPARAARDRPTVFDAVAAVAQAVRDFFV